MRIAHINVTDQRVGIGSAVRALMDQQIIQGDSPTLFVPQRKTDDENVVVIHNPAAAWEESMHAFEAGAGLTGLSAGALLDLRNHPRFLEADIVHLHATAPAYFSYFMLPALAAKPLLWSIYEAQPYTAGCSHTAMCQGWQARNCRLCPLLPPDRQERATELFGLKKALYEMTPFAAVPANAWLAGQVKESILAGRFAAEIPPAVDPAFFQRVARQQVRQQLNIAQDAFVMACVIPGGMAHPLYGGPALTQLLQKWRTDNQNVVLLQLGGGQVEDPLPAPFERRTLPFDLPPEQRSAAFQAADVFLQLSPYDAVGTNLIEASAAGIPPVAFPLAAGSLVRHLETGYLLSSDSIDELVQALQFLRRRPQLAQRFGEAAAVQMQRRCEPRAIASTYLTVYDRLRAGDGRTWAKMSVKNEMPLLPMTGGNLPDLWETLGMAERLARTVKQGVEALWAELDACCRDYPAERTRERGAFVDLFMSFVLSRLHHPLSPAMLNDVIEQWLRHRKLPQLCGDFSPLEKQALQTWTKLLRQALKSFLEATSADDFAQLSIFQQGRLIELWSALFFNDCSTPYLEDAEHRESRHRIESTTSTKRLYPDLLIRSMYTPFPPESVKLDMGHLLKRKMPVAIQVILAFWVVNVPYSDGDEKRQRIMRRNAADYLRSALKTPDLMPLNIFFSVLPHFVVQFWRAAYLGGNLCGELSLFGDFLQRQIQGLYPKFSAVIAPQPRTGDRRLRIGYVSTNFCIQAVSYYMANRIFCADKQKFEVFVFSLEKRHDAMTDRIKSFSDHFVAFSQVNMRDLTVVAEEIKKSELDILIFADIGMEPITYQLGAMRLAPVQCVLVGHGATTGLPTMDYYISGDFEGPQADTHYREQLVRLPNLGAAQLPPPSPPSGRLQRKSFGLPEDKVLLVSCANGIKHGPERDRLLVRILQQAPRAMIVLKPFMGAELTQPQWMRRVREAAEAGGVGDRLMIVPPLAQGQDLMDFLQVSDIQLDTFPYGGWTTNMEAVYAGLAIVTQEGEQGRSRWGAHILRALGITAGIASTEDEYVRQAVELANNDELRRQVRQQIKERAIPTLFNGASAQPAYEAELLKIYEQSLTRSQQAVQS